MAGQRPGEIVWVTCPPGDSAIAVAPECHGPRVAFSTVAGVRRFTRTQPHAAVGNAVAMRLREWGKFGNECGPGNPMLTEEAILPLADARLIGSSRACLRGKHFPAAIGRVALAEKE